MSKNIENKKAQMPSYDDSKIISFGLGMLFVVFVALGGWMAYAPLAASSVAAGQVSADLDKKTIQHLEGGKVDAIYVKDGDSVTKGQVLLKLRDVQIKAQLNILNAQYQDAIAYLSRLKAQRDDKKTISFPAELRDENAIKDQQNIFETTQKTLQDEQSITQKRLMQTQNQIDGLYSLIKSKQKRLTSIQEEIAEWEILFKQRLVDKQHIRDLQRESNDIEGNLANTGSEIAKLKEQSSELETQQLLREKEFKKDVLQRYVETKSRASDLKAKIVAAEDTLERTKVISPIDGTIVGFTLHTVGGIIPPGSKILDIVPKDAKLIVVAKVSITDIDKVKVGQLAEVMFSAFNLKQVPVIQGNVIYISADSYLDKATGAPYYEAKIQVNKAGEQTLLDNKFVLVSGMPAEVMIKIGTRTVLSYFVKPFTNMLHRSLNEE